MASTAASALPARDTSEEEVSLLRLYILRAMYLLMIVGLGAMVMPEVLSHAPASRGVIPGLLAGLWALAFLGLRYPLAMLPLLMFELAWKTIWMIAYGLPQWFSGQRPPTFAEDFLNIGWGAILLLVIPWGYVWRRFVRRPGERWS
jgi:hypothetical protein